MALSPPTKRKLLHTRQVTCTGYEREDGLWDIEGHIADVKTDDILNQDGTVKLKAGEPLHNMRLRITVDSSLTIFEAEAHTKRGSHRECPVINPAYSALKGLTIGPGFSAAVKALFKGVAGCTHITELIGPVATTAFQTLWPVMEKRFAPSGHTLHRDRGHKRPPLIDGCYAWRAEGEAVKARWPAFHK